MVTYQEAKKINEILGGQKTQKQIKSTKKLVDLMLLSIKNHEETKKEAENIKKNKKDWEILNNYILKKPEIIEKNWLSKKTKEECYKIKNIAKILKKSELKYYLINKNTKQIIDKYQYDLYLNLKKDS